MKYFTILLCLSVTLVNFTNAQRAISGIIMDKKGQPIIGAAVQVVGTTTGTVTDVDGRYKLNTPRGSKEILISATGYESEKMTIMRNLPNSMSCHLRRKRKSDFKPFYFSLSASYNYVSEATTDPIGLDDKFSQRINMMGRIGFQFVRLKKITLSVETGYGYRDFGFKQNNSNITYHTIPLVLNLRIGKPNGVFGFEVYGGGEFAFLHTGGYSYWNAASTESPSWHNIFLHQNDAFTGVYGGALSIGREKLRFFLFSEKVIQLDNYDLQYGKTIGSTGLGLGLRFKLF